VALDYRERKELRAYREDRRRERRLVGVRLTVITVFALLLAQYWYLQVVQGEEFARLAEHNALKREVAPPLRGRIYDRAGRLLASNRPGFNIYWNRERVRDEEATAASLAAMLEVTPGEIRSLLEAASGRPSFQPVLIGEGVAFRVAAAVDARRLELAGIRVEEEPVRDYDRGAALAHVIGYLREASEREIRSSGPRPESERLILGDVVGKTGIERLHDSGLRGTKGAYLVKVDSFGRRLSVEHREREPVDGVDLQLTLDLDLQIALVEALGERQGAGVFLDPRDGAILALASSPSFDPNLFSGRLTREAWRGLTEDGRHPLQNRALQGRYPPGSTFKVVAAAAGLAEGVITRETRAWCPGHARFYGRTHRCWKRGGHGWVDLHAAIRGSCNIYFYNLGKTLGVDTLARWAKRFGLGAQTGVDLGGDAAGTIPSKAWKRETIGEIWYPGETISIAIGQGYLEVTPLQMARLAAAVANGGVLVRPHLTAPPPDQGGEPESVGLAPAHLARLRAGLEAVVNETGGTGGRCRLPDVRVAGKTGTVQVVSDPGPDGEGPEDHSWFIGYAPAEAPTVAFAVIVEHGGHGSERAAPVVRKVLDVLFGAEAETSVPVEQMARAASDP
jgi:penicillin-binding protein 2